MRDQVVLTSLPPGKPNGDWPTPTAISPPPNLLMVDDDPELPGEAKLIQIVRGVNADSSS